MADTPNSNYFSSPSPSPSSTTQATPEWRRDDSPVDGPGLYDVVGVDDIPDITTLHITDDVKKEEEYVFRSPLPSKPISQPQPTTQTPQLSKQNKRHKKMENIRTKVDPKHVALAWMFVAIEVRNSPVAQTLRTGFNLKPSLEEIFETYKELVIEFRQTMKSLPNLGMSNLCFVNFLRDMMEIPNLAMIRMRRVLMECKCCAKHQSRRPLCQEKKREPDYDIHTQPIPGWDDCKCACRHLMRRLEQALLDEVPLEVNRQLWERSQ